MLASEALQRLKEGNERFLSGQVQRASQPHLELRETLTSGQSPFAIILGCSDSRVPAELIFDQTLGDLFIVRVAGNIATPAGTGSIEYAASQLGTRLIVVLGHSQCGAVKATLGALQDPTSAPDSENLQSLIQDIRPAVEPLLQNTETTDLTAEAVRANVEATTQTLRSQSPLLQDLIANEGLEIIGAEYSLETGVVNFFEN